MENEPAQRQQAEVGSYPACREQLPATEIESGNYLLRFAQTEKDLDEILKLRFAVFNVEMGEGLESSFRTQRDEDEFDATCHHLMVLHLETDEVIGTYRMQTEEMALTGSGFYSSTEFDLSGLDPAIWAGAVELGRACITKEHRNGRVLFLLWKGLGEYLLHNKKRYLFGCCSLTSQDPGEGKRVMNFLERHGHVQSDLVVHPQPGFHCYRDGFTVEDDGPVTLPRLMKLYLAYGAKLCGPPAIDRLFKTIDFLALFDFESMDERTRKMFVES